jgi:methyl-accepting chemotaxis protein
MQTAGFNSIRMKMVAGFTIIALIAGAIGAFGVWKVLTINSSSQHLYDKTTVPIGQLANFAMESQRARVNIRGMLLDNDEDRAAANAASVAKRYDMAEKILVEFEKNIVADTGRKELEAVRTKMKEYRPLWEEIVKLRLSGNEVAALDLMRGTAQKMETAISADILKLMETKIDEGKKRSQENAALAAKTVTQVVVFSLLGVVVAVCLGFFVAARITSPIRAVMEQARCIADGNLTVKSDVTSSDETGKLSESMNDMVQNLNHIMVSVSASSRQLDSSSHTLRGVSEQMAEGTSEVASQAITLSAAGEEMSATAGDIARNCIESAQAADAVSQQARSGAEVVNDTVVRMNCIAEKVRETAGSIELLGQRSDQIGAIIGTIEDIADQTNLLALNAAIEAARAGEQGRGFAVVADEVRALAERTSRATREISEMIRGVQQETRTAVATMEGSVHEVEAGIRDAERSRQALDEIIRQTGDISSQVNQIAVAAEEQTATTGEISNNIHRINEAIQQAARGAEDSSSESAVLSGQAEQLQQLVSRFRLAG